jgi:uncharacterized damage-inducible protein DinB
VTTSIDPSFPVGKFQPPSGPLPAGQRAEFLQQIADAPTKLEAAIKGLNDKQLDTPYRDGGWTPRQVVHHVADSHMNAFIRFKLALTEDNPTIKPYEQDLWANLADQTLPVDVSMPIVHNLHQRWVTVLRSMQEPDWARTFTHPELGMQRLDRTLALYAWHGRHHVAHITSLRDKQGW